LVVTGLDAYYGDSHILQGISLSIGPGDRVSVIGRNGAGKSTLFKSIMNAGPRVTGRVQWEGRDLKQTAAFRRARMGLALVPEDRRIFTHLSVVENLLIAGQAGASDTCAAPDELIASFPMLDSLRTRRGNQLSGGQQQMLAVARGFVSRPQLLLLDEPTEGLAPVIVQQMAQALIATCQANSTALLLSEQNLRFARRCTDYVYVLDSGRVVFDGTWAAFDANAERVIKHLAV
jgi:branched-chain amino acid transport system ATP-binding protein